MLSGTVWMRKNQEKWTAIIDAKQVSTPSVNLTCVAHCIKELNVAATLPNLNGPDSDGSRTITSCRRTHQMGA